MFIVPEEFDLLSISLDSYVKMNEKFYPNFSRDVLKACLNDFELSEDINLKELSMGQKKKVYMSIALAANTNLLLMDEPTSALDPISTSKIEDCVMELKDKYTIVIVTHNMQQAVRISDKTVFFLLGEIIEEGNTEQIFSKPKMKKTEDYISGRFG